MQLITRLIKRCPTFMAYIYITAAILLFILFILTWEHMTMDDTYLILGAILAFGGMGVTNLRFLDLEDRVDRLEQACSKPDSD